MTYTVTRLKTNKVETIRAGRADDAIKTYKAIRVEELNVEYAGSKMVSTSRVEDDADGGYVLSKDGKGIRRFNIFTKTYIPTRPVSDDYQDATQKDWNSGKFHS